MSEVKTEDKQYEEEMEHAVRLFSSLRSKFEEQLLSTRIDCQQLEALIVNLKRSVASVFSTDSEEYKNVEHLSTWSFLSLGPVPQESSFGNPFSFSADPRHEERSQLGYHEAAKHCSRAISKLIDLLNVELVAFQKPSIEQQTLHAELQLLLSVCQRLKQAGKALTERRADKKPFEIQDEYDVQDLLQFLIRSYFKYSIKEPPLGKVAGVAAIGDIGIEELGVIVEVKYVFEKKGEQKRIVNQLSADIAMYEACVWMKHLVCVIFNSERLKDPELLTTLGGRRVHEKRDFEVHILLC